MLRTSLLLTLTLILNLNILAKVPERTYQIPVKLEPFLAGNFAELRNNHFHAGIDFKTLGSVGHNLYSFDDGWVSRVAVSPRGYGLCLYIDHYNGLTTVYAHLKSFSPKIAKIVEDLQYEKETFVLDQNFAKGEIPVKRGEVIALSGNSGSSSGPHLHFEIRDTESENPVDPLIYFMDKIKDTTPPQVYSVRVIPMNGVVNNSKATIYAAPIGPEKNQKTLNKKITAWGEIALATKAYDRMDGVHNTFGVKRTRVYLNDTIIFALRNDRFSFDETRYINSLMDYKEWTTKRSLVYRLYREPGNKLRSYSNLVNDGIININEEKIYNVRIEYADAYGNTTYVNFEIEGKKQNLCESKKPGMWFCPYDQYNFIDYRGMKFEIPKGNLYNDLDFKFDVVEKPNGYSDLYKLHNIDTPLHSYCPLEIPLTNDIVDDKSKYFIATLRHGKPVFHKSEYKEGKLKASIRVLGDYYVEADTVPPVLSALTPQSWGKSGVIRYRIDDKSSGVKTWRGEVDGHFALFEYDEKVGYISYKIDRKRVERNKTHTMKMVLIDNCGNETIDERTFFW